MTLAACESTFGLGLEEVEISATGLERWKTWLDEGRVAWPMEDGQVALERAAEWNSSFKPFNSFEMYLTFQAATHALRVERCQHHERALRSLQMMRAVRRWDADRRNLAEELGSRIDRQPAVVARKLASTRHGCEWLIERWEGLQLALATPEGWEEPQLTMALNLLGTPMELREVAAVAIPARRDEVVRAEIDRLRTLKAEGLDELDAFERAAAEAGIAPDDRPRAEIKRYERSCALGLQWAHGQLKKARHDYRPDGPAPGRTPAQTPSTSTSTAPAPRSESDYRDELRALAARKKAGAEAERGGAEPPEPRPILPEPVVAIPAPEAPRPIDVASPPVEAPSAPIGNPSEFLARTHEGRIQALMAGVVAMAAGRVAPPVANRRARAPRRPATAAEPEPQGEGASPSPLPMIEESNPSRPAQRPGPPPVDHLAVARRRSRCARLGTTPRGRSPRARPPTSEGLATVAGPRPRRKRPLVARRQRGPAGHLRLDSKRSQRRPGGSGEDSHATIRATNHPRSRARPPEETKPIAAEGGAEAP